MDFTFDFRNLTKEQIQIIEMNAFQQNSQLETVQFEENSELENIEKEYIKSLRIGLKEGHLSNIQGLISGFISTLGNLLLTYLGIMQVINGDITLGTMMAFTTLSGYFMDPIGRLVELQLTIQEANISMKRISEILDYEREQDIESKGLYSDIESVNGDIEIKNITFRYGNRKPVLNNVSFEIKSGEKYSSSTFDTYSIFTCSSLQNK